MVDRALTEPSDLCSLVSDTKPALMEGGKSGGTAEITDIKTANPRPTATCSSSCSKQMAPQHGRKECWELALLEG